VTIDAEMVMKKLKSKMIREKPKFYLTIWGQKAAEKPEARRYKV
jgi:hypothetical protein